MMKRINDNINTNTKKRKTCLEEYYFIPINSGVIYDKIINYRVIQTIEHSKFPNIFFFSSIEESEKYIEENKINNAIIRVLVYQDGFYLLDKNGFYIDKKTNLKYSFVDMKRYSEWDISYLKNNISLDII